MAKKKTACKEKTTCEILKDFSIKIITTGDSNQTLVIANGFPIGRVSELSWGFEKNKILTTATFKVEGVPIEVVSEEEYKMLKFFKFDPDFKRPDYTLFDPDFKRPDYTLINNDCDIKCGQHPFKKY